MLWPEKKLDFGSTETAQKYRLQLLAYFTQIAVVVWLVASVYYWAAEQYSVASVCLFAGLTSATTLFLCHYRPSRLQIAVHIFVLGNVLSLCASSVVSWGTHSQDVLYYPIVVFITAQLVGIRGALVWTLPLVISVVLTYTNNVGLDDNVGLHVDRLIHSLGAIATAVWISFETEKYSKRQKNHLVALAEKLQDKTRQLELAEETAGVGHWLWSPDDARVSMSNEAYEICALKRATSDSSITLNDFVEVWDTAYHPLLFKSFRILNKNGETSEFKINLSYEHQDGIRHVSCRGIYERDDEQNIVGIFGTLRDDTDLRLISDRLSVKAEELSQLANFDSLTGLANRFQFQKKMDKQIAETIASDRQSALLVLDMDGFKEINDSLGHLVGDKVLKVVAKRLTRLSREGDLVARLGGDEFTVLLGKVVDRDEVADISQRFVDAVANPMNIDGHELIVGVSIGGSLCPQDSMNSVELLAYSDTAMYDAKARKCGVAMYEADMTKELMSRRLVENRLRGALERNEFFVLYQPQADIDTGTITGFECLIRWQEGVESMSPLEFIPPLETSGKIIEVGRWVLDQACQQVAQWQRAGRDLTMAVNISPVQFRETDFVERTVSIIQEHGVNPSSIKIEITEGLLIHDLEDAKVKLFGLKEHGLTISVDDFGTGYSSLAYLKNLPIDQLKIDRAFIKDIPFDDDGTIASSIILLGHRLGLEVIAEGVETHEQLGFIKAHDCNSYQGYLIGEPMTIDACEQLLGLTDMPAISTYPR